MQTINNYWTWLSKTSWFVSGEQNYLPKPKAGANTWSAITKCVFIFNYFLAAKGSGLEKVVPITHEQNIICSKRQQTAKHI